METRSRQKSKKIFFRELLSEKAARYVHIGTTVTLHPISQSPAYHEITMSTFLHKLELVFETYL